MINLFGVRPRGFNSGNAIIALATGRMLRHAFGEYVNLVPVPTVVSDADGWLAGLTARTVHEMNQYGHGVVVGGGNLYENGKLDVDLGALGSLAPPLLLWSVSHGRIYDRRGRLTRRTDSMPDELVAALNRHAVASVSRDEATLDHLRSLGVDAAVLGGCPTLFLRELIPAATSPETSSSGTLLSIRHPRLMNVPHSREIRIHDDVRRLADALAEAGLGPIKLLCHDTRDLSFASTFGDLDYLLPDDPWSYLELLRRAQLVVSFRLHAFLPCLSFGTPTVNVSYDERSLSLTSTIGLGEWDINLMTDEDVVAAVIDRVSRLDDLRELVAASEGRWDELRRTMDSALELFAERVLEYAAETVPVRR